MVPASAAPPNKFTVKRMVTDSTGAPTVDKSLVNPWGMAQGPNTPVWVSDNGSDVSTLYKAGPHPKFPLTVNIPGGAPTGQVYNGSSGFALGSSGSATFIFDSEAGVLSGWNTGTNAVKERSFKTAVFKGLAIASVSGHPRLYATDFHNNRVDVFNGAWKRLTSSTAFKDPNLPAGYAPFGIAALHSHIYVSYAKQDAAKHDDTGGAGHGFVDVFTHAGAFVKRLVSRGRLNSPWGMAVAPAKFGPFGGALLVGNFGNGRIHAYNPTTGAFLGTLKNGSGHAIVLPGLWGLLFGNGVSAPKTAMMFTSGPGGEAHGRWGTISAG
jgi:uncharacterized protein (TIGR03118 family)